MLGEKDQWLRREDYGIRLVSVLSLRMGSKRQIGTSSVPPPSVELVKRLGPLSAVVPVFLFYGEPALLRR